MPCHNCCKILYGIYCGKAYKIKKNKIKIIIADEIVKLGLEDIALKLKTGSVSDKKGEATAFVGGLLGELQQFSQGIVTGCKHLSNL